MIARLLIAFLLLGTLVISQVFLDKRSITLGDVMDYQIVFPGIKELPKTYEVTELFKETGNITVLSVTQSITMAKGLRRRYLLTSFEMDNVFIPTLSIRIDGVDHLYKSIPITVNTTFTKTITKNAVLIFKPQANITFKWWNYLLALAIAMGAFFGVRYLLKRFITDTPEDTAPRESLLDPKEEALRKLAKLEGSELWLTELKSFYFQLSTIMKTYLSSRLNYPFLEETTYEIRQSLPQYVSRELAQTVYSFFVTLDPVKYAHHLPSANQSRGLITQARELMDEVEKGI